MNIIEHADGVYEIENFLTDDQLQTILPLTLGDGWNTSHPGNTVKNMSGEVLIRAKEISDNIEQMFDNFTKIIPIGNIRRLAEGEFMHLHKDAGDENAPEPIVFGIAIYLNDDFTGGELSYPNLNLKVKPKVKSMVIHNASYPHEVLPVKSGNRYSITTFVLGNEYTFFRHKG